jgi:hypothetical protein
MKRTVYLVLLVLSLFVFGGFAFLAAWAGITHRHLNSKGVLILFANAYVCWMVIGELRAKIRRRTDPKP